MKPSLGWWLPIGLLVVPLPAHAQSAAGGLAQLVPNLILKGISLPGADDPGRPHAGHFTLGDPTLGGSQPASIPDAATIGAVAAFGDRLRAQFANFPLGSSTGGFTYSFEEASGIYTRSRSSFGPAFTERAATIGRKKLSVGFNYQHSSFDTFGGEDLRDGVITFYLPHTDCCSPAAPPPSPQVPGFEGDLIEAALDLKATTDTVALFANYGVTDRLDVGVAVPITRVDLEANVRATILRLSTATSALIHTFVDGRDVTESVFTSSGTATGLGDVVLRAKYNVLDVSTPASLAFALDLRLPTGKEEDLLGLGTAQGKIFLILSSDHGRVSPHLNVGYTVSGEGSTTRQFGIPPEGVSDEFNYAGGVEIVAHPKLTILADILGRTLIDAGVLEVESKAFPYRVGAAAGAAAPVQISNSHPLTGQPYRQLTLQRYRDLELLLGSAGFKFNPTGNLLVGANILFPLTDAGLRDRLTYVIGLDYAF
jgi:hypothetical protein